MSKVIGQTEPARLMLDAVTAADLMSDQPVSLQADATVAEAVELLTYRGFSAAPVIDLAGRAVGVVSRGDLVIHHRERLATPSLAPAETDDPGITANPARVRDIMTPVVFSVTPDAPAAEVIKQMLEWNVHHLFVIDDSMVLVGAISTHDVLKRLRTA